MGNQNLARAAKAKGLKQIVVISSVGVGNSRDAVSPMYRWPMMSVLSHKGQERGIHSVLRDRLHDHTARRVHEGKSPDEVAFGEGGKITGRVKREQIARVCVDALENPAMKNRTFEVVARAAVQEAGAVSYKIVTVPMPGLKILSPYRFMNVNGGAAL